MRCTYEEWGELLTRPFAVYEGPILVNAGQWFNPAAFSSAPDCRQQAVFTTMSDPLVCFGNAGRNALTGPGLVNFDFALLKKIRLGETQNLAFRTEIFNLFNTPPLGFPVSSLTNPAVGGSSVLEEPEKINSLFGIPSSMTLFRRLKVAQGSRFLRCLRISPHLNRALCAPRKNFSQA